MVFIHVLQLEIMLPVENQESSQSERNRLSLDLTRTGLYLEGILCLIVVDMGGLCIVSEPQHQQQLPKLMDAYSSSKTLAMWC